MVEYVEYVNLQYYFSHPISVIQFFATPSIKVKLGQQISGEPTNSKPPGPIVTMGQSERNTEQQSGQIYYTLLCGFTPLLLLRLFSPATANCGIMLSQKPFSSSNPAFFFFDFSLSDLTCAGSQIQHHWRCSQSTLLYAFFFWQDEMFFQSREHVSLVLDNMIIIPF